MGQLGFAYAIPDRPIVKRLQVGSRKMLTRMVIDVDLTVLDTTLIPSSQRGARMAG